MSTKIHYFLIESGAESCHGYGDKLASECASDRLKQTKTKTRTAGRKDYGVEDPGCRDDYGKDYSVGGSEGGNLTSDGARALGLLSFMRGWRGG